MFSNHPKRWVMLGNPKQWRKTYITFGGFLPVEQPNGIWVPHAQRNQFNVSFSQVLFLQTIDGSLSVFLINSNENDSNNEERNSVLGEESAAKQDKDRSLSPFANAAEVPSG